MILSDKLIAYKDNYKEFENYKIRKEEVTNIYSRVYFENEVNTIRFDIEETEIYISFLISHKAPGGVINYYGLSDYSDCTGEKKSVFETIEEKDGFYTLIKNCFKRHIFSIDKKQNGLIEIIYSFLDNFLKKLN